MQTFLTNERGVKNLVFKQSLFTALNFLEQVKWNKHPQILFVGGPYDGSFSKIMGMCTKQAFITKQWVPGTITNWVETQSHTINYDENMNNIIKTAGQRFYGSNLEMPFRAINTYNKQKIRFEGLRNTRSIPKIIIMFGSESNKVIVNEAQKQLIPIIGIVQQGQYQKGITYPVITSANNQQEIFIAANSILKKLYTLGL